MFGCGGERDKGKRAYMGEIAHFKSDMVIVTNDNPRREKPDQIIRDIVAGWPEKVRKAHGWMLHPWHQDIIRLPEWYRDQALWAQGEQRRYVIEDRYMAIRSAIYTAQKDDVVVIAGKGHEDYQEWEDPENPGKLAKGWFDDRVEARNALSKLPYIQNLVPGLNRSEMPWMWPGQRRLHPLDDWDDEGSGSSD